LEEDKEALQEEVIEEEDASEEQSEEVNTEAREDQAEESAETEDVAEETAASSGAEEETQTAEKEAADAETIKVVKPEASASEEETSESVSDEEEASEEAEEEKAEEEHQLSEEDREIAERIRLRKLEARAKNRRMKFRFISIATLVVLALVFFILSFTSIFTVDSIEVKGNSHYTSEEIISMGHAVPGKNLIYHSDKASIKEYLELNPYIKSAEVKRKLPSTLVIKVTEREQMMALAYDDDYLILDREGILLQKSRTKPKLTLIEGNVITRIKLGEPLGTQNDDLIVKSVDLMQAMADNDLYFVKVDMSDLYSVKAYVYDSLTVKTDYDKLMENIKNGRLHMVLDKLFEDSIKRGTITFDDEGNASFMPNI
jgi:cell division protein FtsQ